ncbi:MAG: bifunctional 5,10-methylenetetrahydrofolate dehydrogenase/5,10-methenyltetrahydrofolate cyclohydrolase [Candidatus Pacebacteria bacterium]|nr:bifunctional 5,10-methylenetetrahydrofolate dehydrogenase/5,10-methenyltetrahydrofolate cyclohydrolase [Candidatus Paceibacterota bacterium]
MYEKFVDGKKIRDFILKKIKPEFDEIKKRRNKVANISIFVIGENKVTDSFIKRKRLVAKNLEIDFMEFRYGENDITEKELIKKIQEVSDITDGIIVQLPLPLNFNTQKVLNSIPVNLDVDLLNEDTLNYFLEEQKQVDILPPVSSAIYEILKANKFNLKNKNILLVGYGKLVGQPMSLLFDNLDIKYVILRSKTLNKNELYKKADLIISGVGIPELIKPEMLKDKVALIDAGTSTANQKIVGDISLNCIDKSIFFSKTPGGVGPITIAIIYKNLLNLIKKNI